MAGNFSLPTVLANLAAGNQALSLIDGDFTACYDPLVALNTFSNYYADSGAANAYTITVSSPQTVSQVVGLRVQFKAANANTGASTLQINALASKNILNMDGTALSSGQIPASAIVDVMYDGTQYLLLTTKPSPLTLATEQATSSGTSWDFTGIPASAKRIVVMIAGFSTNGTSDYIVQLGDSGGVETSGYLGSSSFLANATSGCTAFTTGFGIYGGSAAIVMHGSMVIEMERASTFMWVARGVFARSDAAVTIQSSGRKATSAALDRVRLTTVNGTDAGDAGVVNVLYE